MALDRAAVSTDVSTERCVLLDYIVSFLFNNVQNLSRSAKTF